MEWLFVVGYGSFPHSPLSTIKAANMSSLFQDSDLMVHAKWVSLPSMILRRRQRYAVSLQGEEACLAQLVSCPTQLNSGSVNPSEKTIKSTIESISSHQPELLPLMKVDPNPKNTENPSYKFSWDPHGPTLPSPPHLKAMAPVSAGGSGVAVRLAAKVRCALVPPKPKEERPPLAESGAVELGPTKGNAKGKLGLN